MQESIQNFQKQLKHKLQYKASSKISPDTFLYKSFKFFDLYNNGYLSKSDFFKAIAKCGVVVDTHDLQNIYNHYDTHKDRNIHYKQFIQSLLFSQNQQNSLKMSQSQISQNKRHQQTNPQHRNNQEIQLVKNSRNTQNNKLKQSNINRIYQDCQTYSDVVQNIKRNLKQKGISSLINLAVQLKRTDTRKTHRINKEQLHSRLQFLSQKAINLIIRQFSDGQSNQINYAQFIYSLKDQLDSTQQSIINRAFQYLDVRCEREVEIQKVVNSFKIFNYKSDLIKAINQYEIFQGIDDGIFTDEDFLDFFGFIAFSFYDVQQFIIFIEKAYLDFDNQSQNSQRSNRSRQFKRQINEGYNKKNISNQNNNGNFRKNKQENLQLSNHKHKSFQNQHQDQANFQSQKPALSRRSDKYSQSDKKSSATSYYIKEVQMIVLRIKKRLASKGTKGYLVFQRALKQIDTDNDGLINIDQFKKVIKDLKIDIINNQCNLLFDVFDPDSTNFISFSQIVQTLKGQIPQKRKQCFDRVWNSVKLNDQYTNFSNLKQSLNFRGHPDIQTGRRYDDQILKQINQTILLIQQLNETPRNQNITKKQFFQYFENLSLSINEDQLFQSILNNFWKMQSKTNINQMYAGSRKLFDPSKKSYLMDHHRYAVKGGSISSNAPFGTSNQPTNYFTQHQKL